MTGKVKNITYTIRQIIFDNGNEKILCMTNKEYAGFLRQKGIRKVILTNKKLFSFSIQLKNHL